MKKILLLLLCLVGALSINAQTIEIYYNGNLYRTYTNTTDNKYQVVAKKYTDDDQEDTSEHQKFVVYKNGTQVCEISNKTYPVIVKFKTTQEINDPYEYVDLGLPSGTLWATKNIGASSPESRGEFFAWGDIEPHNYDSGYEETDYVFSWSNYKWHNASYTGENAWKGINKYQIADGETSASWYDSTGKFIGDGKKFLDSDDDAATQNWNTNWCIPTKEQFIELAENTNVTKVTGLSTVSYGYKFTCKTDDTKYIIIPAAGIADADNGLSAEKGGKYWTNEVWFTIDSENNVYYENQGAFCFYFDENGVLTGKENNQNWEQFRCYGCPIRPVRMKK